MFSSIGFADQPEGKGFVDGHNETAKLYNTQTSSWYPDTKGSVVIKYNEGWLTNHWTWYTDVMPDYGEYKAFFDLYPLTDFITIDENAEFGEGAYRIENFLKLKTVAEEDVPALEAKGFVVIYLFDYLVFLKNDMVIYNQANEVIAEYDFLDYDFKINQGVGNKKY